MSLQRLERGAAQELLTRRRCHAPHDVLLVTPHCVNSNRQAQRGTPQGGWDWEPPPQTLQMGTDSGNMHAQKDGCYCAPSSSLSPSSSCDSRDSCGAPAAAAGCGPGIRSESMLRLAPLAAAAFDAKPPLPTQGCSITCSKKLSAPHFTDLQLVPQQTSQGGTGNPALPWRVNPALPCTRWCRPPAACGVLPQQGAPTGASRLWHKRCGLQALSCNPVARPHQTRPASTLPCRRRTCWAVGRFKGSNTSSCLMRSLALQEGGRAGGTPECQAVGNVRLQHTVPGTPAVQAAAGRLRQAGWLSNPAFWRHSRGSQTRCDCGIQPECSGQLRQPGSKRPRSDCVARPAQPCTTHDHTHS